MIKVGITGGIGSGKTFVCKIFESIGIPIFDADSRAKKIMSSDREVKQAVKQLLGADAYYRNGRLNRKYISAKVFGNKKLLGKLNGIIHPAVAKEGEMWFDSQKTKYAIKEAALLVESGSYKTLDYLIVVTAPKDIRVQRVMARDGIEKAQVLARIKNQMQDEEKIKFGNFIIVNDGKKSLIKQVLKIHQKLMKGK
ncbi:MAG: hypothetical protein RLZZ546_784 [Bacteroidota bacterium]